MPARHHHYLSQCYLKGFTKGGGKKSKLTVIDFKENKSFETIPRNVGGIRDFNRVDIAGIDQNGLENSLSQFESEAATALRRLEESLQFEGETKTLILNLIALLAIRSPEMREQRREFHADVVEKIMDLSLATKERWESQMRQMKEAGKEINENITFEEIKRFHKSKKYDITLAREYHIHLEFVGLDAILPCLNERKWLLIKATDESGPFVTSDKPVTLSWKEPEKIPPFYRNSPGYAMKSTQVYFPVSKNLALVGEFEGPEGTIDGNKELISALNTIKLIQTYKQVYCPKLGFYFRGMQNELLEGTQVLKQIGSQ